MNKAELIDAIQNDIAQDGMPPSKADIDIILAAQGRVIANHLANRDADQEAEATLPGLGKLKTNTRAERTGRNPQTGAAIQIPERVAVKFRPGKDLDDALNP